MGGCDGCVEASRVDEADVREAIRRVVQGHRGDVHDERVPCRGVVGHGEVVDWACEAAGVEAAEDDGAVDDASCAFVACAKVEAEAARGDVAGVGEGLEKGASAA